MNQFSKILSRVSRISYYLLILLVPVFFLPFTSEFLEFNKQYLFYALVLVSLLTWIGSSVSERKFEFRRTPLDLPLLALWVVYLASTLASKDRQLSFLGNFENLNTGFLPVSFYILFYFLSTNIAVNAERIKLVFRMLLASGAIGVIYFVAQYLGLLAKIGWGLKLQNPMAGLSTHFGFFILFIMLISLNEMFSPKKKLWHDVLWFLAFAVSLLVVAVIGFKLLWIVAAVGLFFLLVFAISRLEELRTSWISIGFAVFILALLFTFLGTPSFLTFKLPVEVSLSNAVTWKMATQSLSEGVLRFALGSGPSTFSYVFSQYRPEALNTTFIWNVRFNQGASSFLDFLSTTGFLGVVALLVTFLLALGTILYLWTRRPARNARRVEFSEDPDGSMLSASTAIWLSLLLIFFVASMPTVLWMTFILMMAITMTLSRSILAPEAKPWSFSLKTSPQYGLASSFGFILLFSAVVVLGAYLGRFYAANIAYARSIKAINQNNLEVATKEASRAVNIQPGNVNYNLMLAQAYLLRAVDESVKSGPNVGLITNYLSYAVNGARQATTIAPNYVAGWESLATMYANAVGVAPDANDWVIKSLDKAIELEGSNPVHFLRRGNAKVVAKDLDGAKKDYEEAIRLKADYVDAYTSLALLEEAQGNLDSALVHMMDAARLSNQNIDIIFQLGRLAYNRNKEGDMALAEQAFLATLQLNPNYSNSLFSLGLLYERQGKRSEALDYYRRVQRLNPQDEQIKKKIDSFAPADNSGE